jgi:hypothetical protein
LQDFVNWAGMHVPADMPSHLVTYAHRATYHPNGHWHHRTGLRNDDTGELREVRDYFFKVSCNNEYRQVEILQWWELAS